jgi:uncharacterized protein (TIGR02217 family)
MSFVEIRLPTSIKLSPVGGPEFMTDVTETLGGREQRNILRPNPRRRYEIGMAVMSKSDFAVILAFFIARKGRAYGFRFKDFSDFSATGEAIGTGDGATVDFQLVKNYVSSVTYARTIKKPVSGSVAVYLNGSPQASGWSVDTTTGVITFDTAPGSGVAITADFEFDVPVRFDMDRLDVVMPTGDLCDAPSVQLIELVV